MIRITRLTDYGIVLLARIAETGEPRANNVPSLAADTRLPAPTVSKILKALAREGLLVSHRGVKGGYSLSRRPEQISVIDIIGALDGPIAITDCSHDLPGKCDIETGCPVRSNWQRINLAVRESLEQITLAEMMRPQRSAGFVPVGDLERRRSPVEAAEICQ